jgi:HNH endonuclease
MRELPTDSGLPLCLRKPIPEIAWAAQTLLRAMQAHVAGDSTAAAALIASTNLRAIRDWTESLWGKKSPYLAPRAFTSALGILAAEERIPVRMPNSAQKRALIAAQGMHCGFCGIPLIREETRRLIRSWYPEALPWGRTNADQHAAFQAMWLQYDHLVPHARGGGNALDNIVITCAPCNFARMQYVIQELGLDSPLARPAVRSDWDGLESLLQPCGIKCSE